LKWGLNNKYPFMFFWVPTYQRGGCSFIRLQGIRPVSITIPNTEFTFTVCPILRVFHLESGTFETPGTMWNTRNS